jgi:hypothetical protein
MLEGKGPLRCSWEDNIKINFGVVKCESVCVGCNSLSFVSSGKLLRTYDKTCNTIRMGNFLK